MAEGMWTRIFDKIEQISVIQVIRNGLVMMIPILLLGSFSLVLQTLPLAVYQRFIHTFLSGALFNIFELVYDGTFGMLSVYMALAMSFSCAQSGSLVREMDYGAVITSLACFTLSSGFLTEEFSADAFSVKGMFLAIFCALLASWMYRKIAAQTHRKRLFFSDGADVDFNNAVATILPSAVVILFFALINLMIYKIWGYSGLQEMFVSGAEHIFHGMGRNLGSGLLFVILSSLLWFMGVHGSDVLDNISQSLFAEGISVNTALVAAGQPPTEIVTKTFFDVFVLMGGCGSTLCLLVALTLFSKQRSNRGLARMAAFPMLFNINELMVFGLPIVFNPILFIPFLLTPIVCTLTAYLSLSSGLVPIPATTVAWTTPILWGGYAATGSAMGVVLQFVNLMIGTLIYKPFVKVYDREKSRSAQGWVQKLQTILIKSEENNRPVDLLQIPGQGGKIAKMLAADLQYAIAHEELYLCYQPQFDCGGQCIGVEALLRWKHPLVGNVYPPLIIALADESDQLFVLEEHVVRLAMADFPKIRETWNSGFRLCINVTAKNIVDDRFLNFLEATAEKEQIRGPVEISLEVTEQTVLSSERIEEQFQRIREMGFSLSIDDFSMGFTSLKYLQQSQFSLVKLDGSLVRDLIGNKRNQEIISSIVHLSHSLGFSVLAEYVETNEQQIILEQVGCLQYQGYLYSPPVSIEEVLKLN